MPNVEKHAPGAFTWIELSTTDQDAAKAFYSSLFGWTIDDQLMGPSGTYTMFQIDGRNAGAAYTMQAEERATGAPPHWNLYIAVVSADDAASRAKQLGGTVHVPPFDVMDAGRMAVLGDPTGAVFCVWQAKKLIGLRIAGVDGTLCWADLSTPDPEKARKFYEGMFGWKISAGEKDPSGYLHIQNGEAFIGGIPPIAHRDPHMPPHWLAYFQVGDVDATTSLAQQQGAKVHLAPMSMENVGRMAVLSDPQGASFAIFKASGRG
jgi:uncharacterized protein